MKKSTYIFWFTIAAAYFATRLVNLKIIPIFTDEAIYSYWAQVALNDPANRFISLEDGKQPLFIWLAAISQYFINDPLIASRLVSVISGFFSLIGIYLLSKELFNEKVAKIASVLYLIVPFTLLYDRIALYDSLLTMLGIYAIFFSVKMAKTPRLDLAMLNGFAIGLAMITKSSGNFFLYLLPLSYILFDFKAKAAKTIFLKLMGFSIVTLALSQIIYNSLRLSELFYLISRKNTEFIRPLSQVLIDPLDFFWSNFSAITGWVMTYLSIPLFVLFIAGIIIGLYKKNLKIFYLFILILVPILAESMFNKILYARFVLFYFPYILIITAFAVSYVLEKYQKNTKIVLVTFAVLALMPAITSVKLLTDPSNAKIPKNDSEQYFNSWPAGFGVEETVFFLKSQSVDQKINVGTEGTFGLLPFALNIYFFKNDSVHISSYWPVNENDLPAQVLESAKFTKTYFIFNANQKEINNPGLKLISKYKKGTGDSFMRLYLVMPE
jgi:4-amino-4-deoxy-L-arabinose transferase-like glycosyltransferase